jgi:hypothetical protein
MDEEKKIVLNRIKCRHCDDIIISYSVHDYRECKCGRVAVDGGREYLKRTYTSDTSDYIEMSLYEDAPFEEIRKYVRWGTYGKDAKGPLTFVFLNEMTNEHIRNILRNVQHGGGTIRKFFAMEWEYRKQKNILIEDNE